MRLSTRLTVAMVALVLLATTAVGVLTYRNIASIALPRALDRLDTHAHLLGGELAASVRGARADVIGFRSAVAVNDIMTAHLHRGVDSAAAATEAESRRRLGQRFAAELASKPNYHEFRVIGVDDGGREIVRVDRSGPGRAIRIVPDNELQREGDSTAFAETIRLPAGEVYVSAVDLDQDNGVIETPHVPVVRIATPVHTPDGQPFAIVIIDVDMRPRSAGSARTRPKAAAATSSMIKATISFIPIRTSSSASFSASRFVSRTTFWISRKYSRPAMPRLACCWTGPAIASGSGWSYCGWPTVRELR